MTKIKRFGYTLSIVASIIIDNKHSEPVLHQSQVNKDKISRKLMNRLSGLVMYSGSHRGIVSANQRIVSAN